MCNLCHELVISWLLIETVIHQYRHFYILLLPYLLVFSFYFLFKLPCIHIYVKRLRALYHMDVKRYRNKLFLFLFLSWEITWIVPLKMQYWTLEYFGLVIQVLSYISQVVISKQGFNSTFWVLQIYKSDTTRKMKSTIIIGLQVLGLSLLVYICMYSPTTPCMVTLHWY